MIVLCAGMYRSGSTLQFQVASELIELKGLGKRVEWMDLCGVTEYISKTNFAEWKVIKTHEINDQLLNCIKDNVNNFRVLYIYRDLRDVFLSHMIKNNLSFEDLFNSTFLDHCIKLFEMWNQLPNIYSSRYEDVINDLSVEVENISIFLNIPFLKEEMLSVSQKYSFENQQKRIRESENMEFYQGLKFDKQNLLHHNHLNKGEVGGWKKKFTGNQKKKLNLKLEPWLIKLNYEI